MGTDYYYPATIWNNPSNGEYYSDDEAVHIMWDLGTTEQNLVEEDNKNIMTGEVYYNTSRLVDSNEIMVIIPECFSGVFPYKVGSTI